MKRILVLAILLQHSRLYAKDNKIFGTDPRH